MRATFTDPELERCLDRDGFTVIPLLPAGDVASLRDQFELLGPAPGDPQMACHSSFHTYDSEYKREVDRRVRRILDPHLQTVFDRQRALPCNFIAKWPSAMSGFGLHQDLTLVDEAQFRSVEVWIALEDTNEQNGQLWMVPGSHQWLPGNIRGINGFDFAFNQATSRIMRRHSRPVPVAAGEAIVFNHATLHFSLPNRTDEPRLVAITDLIPQEAEHLHFFGDGQGNIDIYRIDESFWTDNNPFTLWKPPPSSQRLGRSDATQLELTEADLDRLLAEGLVIESDSTPRGAPNAAKAWCHRCGTTEMDAYPPDRLTGNVTMLCDGCRRTESIYAATPGHVGTGPR